MSRVLKNLFSVRVQNAKLLRENPEILQVTSFVSNFDRVTSEVVNLTPSQWKGICATDIILQVMSANLTLHKIVVFSLLLHKK